LPQSWIVALERPAESAKVTFVFAGEQVILTTMKTLKVPVAEAKRRFSAYVSGSAHAGRRVIITKRGQPVAALVNLEDLQSLEQASCGGGLAEVARHWPADAAFSRAVDRIYAERQREAAGRDVSL
jgi:prevent-host-death family protein